MKIDVSTICRSFSLQDLDLQSSINNQVDEWKKNFSTLSSVDENAVLQLSVMRLNSSTTLVKSHDARLFWEKANAHALLKKANELKHFELWSEINHLLQSEERGVFSPRRNEASYTGRVEHPDPSELENYIFHFEKVLEKELPKLHPIEGASLLRAGLYAIHPFKNANGRTANLISDAWLIHHGYLPQCYSNQSESMIAINQVENISLLHYAWKKMVVGLKNSYLIMKIPV